MKYFRISLLFTIFFLTYSLYSQFTVSHNIQLEVIEPPVEFTSNISDWGIDLVAFNNEPMGPVSGVVGANDTIFIAVPDTNGIPTGGLRILKSSNLGANWLNIINVSGTGFITKTRMVKSGLDTVYCTFMTSTGSVYIVRINFPFIDPLRTVFTGNYRDFDCWASTTGGYYIFVDSLYSNNLRRFSSTNGGISWSQMGLVSSSSAGCYISRSLTGDTCVLMYYMNPSGSDTTLMGVTLARYRESSPGTLASISFIQPLIPAGAPKDQFQGILYGSTGWVIYTEGAPGSRNIMLMTSTNNGVNWTSSTPLTAGSADKYWFDLQPFNGGADFIYYLDSTGGPNNTTDKIMYSYAFSSSPGNFSAFLQISQYYPQFSTRGYKPILVEYYNSSFEVAALWVGVDGANRRLYYDRLNAVVKITPVNNSIPETFTLSQNYPNPFNPSTKIDFSIPKNSFVSIKLYDILGKEIMILANKDFNSGAYTLEFDGSSLSSGVYFYKLTAGEFTDTKKMMLVK